LDILNSNIKTLKENPGINVQIEGHTCAHGTDKYNMARAMTGNAVREYLANQEYQPADDDHLWRNKARAA
jgi:outer membrane protein OmpA-like peptidoglycan-associated protein